MKRLFGWLMALCLLLSGCVREPEGTETVRTEPPVTETQAGPTLLEQAEDWDEAGVLKRIPLELLEENPELSVEVLGSKLLLWQFEFGNDQIEGVHLWTVELEYGTVTAERTMPLTDYVQPQIQEDRVCFCDYASGMVTTLDENLEILDQWQTEPDWYTWFLGKGAKLYRLVSGGEILERDLETGEERVVLDHASGTYYSDLCRDGVDLWYTDVELGRQQVAFLNFNTGEVEVQPFYGSYSTCQRAGETWLCRSYIDSRSCRVGTGERALDFTIDGGLMTLLPEGYLLEESVDGNHLYLYDLEGNYLSGCTHTLGEGFFNGTRLKWCEPLGGYLFLLYCWEEDRTELIFWDLSSGLDHEDLVMTEADLTVTAEEELEELRSRAEALGEEYGLKIWLGSDCQTEFDDFTANLLTDPAMVELQLDVLENALAGYPEGFLDQLHYGDYQQIHIQLVADLMAKSHYGTGGSYGGFVQPRDGYYLMVINTNYSAEGTYYHEFSHIIDDYLEWDSWQREDALYSEDEWLALNPEGFDYSYDYAVLNEFEGNWDEYFIDQYAMINSTEDRARTMEYGMLGYMQWRFDEMPGVVEKLRYYSACIRDAFDTTGWPEELLWEQYIP